MSVTILAPAGASRIAQLGSLGIVQVGNLQHGVAAKLIGGVE